MLLRCSLLIGAGVYNTYHLLSNRGFGTVRLNFEIKTVQNYVRYFVAYYSSLWKYGVIFSLLYRALSGRLLHYVACRITK